MKYSIVLGQDPMVWLLSGTRLAPRFTDAPQDELAIAGGMRGKPIDVVRSEDTDILIPAHAEFVIEGEVQLNGPFEDEGPFAEMFGYLGPVKVWPPGSRWRSETRSPKWSWWWTRT